MKKNYFYNLSVSLVNILFPVLSFPYASRILGPVGIGKVQIAISFAQWFSLFAALGIPIYGVQEIAKKKHDPKLLSAAFSELLSIYLITSMLITIVYIGIILTFPYFENNIRLFIDASFIILLGFSTIDWLYAGIENFQLLAVRSIIVKSLSLILLFFVVKNNADYEKYLLIIIFSILGNNIINILMVRRHTAVTLKALNLKKHIKPLLFVFGTTIASSVYTVMDSFILGILSDAHAVGLYTAAIKLCKISIPIIISLGAVLIPSIATNFNKNNLSAVQDLLHKSFRFISFISIPIAFGLVLLSDEFIVVFSGQDFLAASPSMKVLSVLPLLISFGYFFAFQILVPGDKNKEVFLSALTGVVVGLILNFMLVPHFKELGASIANAICELIVLLSYIRFAKKFIRLQFEWKLFIHAIITSCIFIPIVWLIKSLGFPALYTLCICVILCSCVYCMIQYFVFKNQILASLYHSFTTSFIKKIH